jgi:hypothetical protein
MPRFELQTLELKSGHAIKSAIPLQSEHLVYQNIMFSLFTILLTKQTTVLPKVTAV